MGAPPLLTTTEAHLHHLLDPALPTPISSLHLPDLISSCLRSIKRERGRTRRRRRRRRRRKEGENWGNSRDNRWLRGGPLPVNVWGVQLVSTPTKYKRGPPKGKMDPNASPQSQQPPPTVASPLPLQPPLHQSNADEEDESVKQLNECSSLYLSLQDCLADTNRNWKSCQKQVQALKACNERRNKDKRK
ncbi:hypothetical protein Vadar_026849 [Vaccinium darrowii]|uniref:Uncharacterized protein n=1 Tax=Vaccinium darrowii TaxID=229202 RepID=A0ACB7YZ01_9ERIC|nr:hypothetical protein Vadar_026849 [Vaccinium darrowii]